MLSPGCYSRQRALASGRTPRWCCATGDASDLNPDLGQALEAQVRAQAGQATRSQRFRREADGSGVALALPAPAPE